MYVSLVSDRKLIDFRVVLMAILRMWSGLRYSKDAIMMYDFTFWFPCVMIFSCLEVDFAIMCASIPIFWPTVKAAWSHITVTQEVIVTSEARHKDVHTVFLEMRTHETASLKSHESTNVLVPGENMNGKCSYVDRRRDLGMLRISNRPRTDRVSWGGTPLSG